MSLTIELDEQTAAVVQELAANEQRTASEVIHDALAAYAAAGKRPLPKGAGRYRSGRTDTSAKVDEILADAVKEGRWP
jgi:predicted transcriptional regulator